MTIKVRLLALGLVALLGLGTFMSAAAWASEPEVPFWNIAGKRFESGIQKASINNVNGVKTTLHSKIGAIEVEIRCGSGALEEGAIEGSPSKHAGKASGVLRLSECKLFARESEELKEQAGCEVPSIKSEALSGAFWLEGKKGTGGTNAVMVFKPKESVIAKVSINSKEGCGYTGAYTLTGSFAMKLIPQNEEFTFMQWVLPQPAITTGWRPPGEEGETSIGLELGGNTASLQGEMKVALISGDAFGGGIAPMPAIEAPFWGVQHKRLEGGEEKELNGITVTESAKLTWKLKGTEVETRCSSTQMKEIKLLGSFNQSDGGFATGTMELSQCKLFVKEGEKLSEQPTCEATPLVFKKLKGRLWLRGTKEERGTKPVLVLEPELLTEGKPVLAVGSIKNKAGEKCGFAEEKYALEGGLLFKITPENEEAPVVELAVTESAALVWQPAKQEAARQIVISHSGEPIIIKIPPFAVNTKTGEGFGGGPVGVGSKGNWFVKGAQLKKGTKQFKLQQKGRSILTASILGSNVEIECNGSISEGGTIEGNGERQGQDKDRLTASSCRVAKPELKGCAITEPITTTQLKSYLAVNEGLQNSIVDVLEPTVGTVFLTFKLLSGCGLLAGSYSISGSTAAEIIPGEKEAQELLFFFPTTPVSKVKHEGPEVAVGLSLGGGATSLRAAYGARLATNEPFGVF